MRSLVPSPLVGVPTGDKGFVQSFRQSVACSKAWATR